MCWRRQKELPLSLYPFTQSAAELFGDRDHHDQVRDDVHDDRQQHYAQYQRSEAEQERATIKLKAHVDGKILALYLSFVPKLCTAR
jgi:hypothetical protein